MQCVEGSTHLFNKLLLGKTCTDQMLILNRTLSDFTPAKLKFHCHCHQSGAPPFKSRVLEILSRTAILAAIVS